MMRRMDDRHEESVDVPVSESGVAEADGHDVLPLFFTPPAPREPGDERPPLADQARPSLSPPSLEPPRSVQDAEDDLAPLPLRRWDGPREPYRTWRPPPRISRKKGILLGVVGLLVVLVGAGIALATWTTRGLDRSVERVPDVFPTGERPARATGLTFLLVGKDPTTATARGVVDSLMLLHVDTGRTRAQVVYLPVYAQVKAGGTTLDEAYGQGGPQQLVRSVEGLTRVRVDHYAEIDFIGFKTVTDALDGADVNVPVPYDAGQYQFPAGRQHLDGEAALAYVRDGRGGPAEQSAQRQQTMITALFDQVSSQGVLKDSATLTSAWQRMASAISVDDTLDSAGLVDLVWSLRGLSPPKFVTAPLTGVGVQNGRMVATFDPARGNDLWKYVRHGTLAKHVSEFQ
jgi:LCP family protein required for cell wall assembly